MAVTALEFGVLLWFIVIPHYAGAVVIDWCDSVGGIFTDRAKHIILLGTIDRIEILC